MNFNCCAFCIKFLKLFCVRFFVRNGCISQRPFCSRCHLSSGWVFSYDNESSADCAQNCVNNCANNVAQNSNFRAAVFSVLDTWKVLTVLPTRGTAVFLPAQEWQSAKSQSGLDMRPFRYSPPQAWNIRENTITGKAARLAIAKAKADRGFDFLDKARSELCQPCAG